MLDSTASEEGVTNPSWSAVTRTKLPRREYLGVLS
jgi:hypothetical protein